jgi:biotin synthase
LEVGVGQSTRAEILEISNKGPIKFHSLQTNPCRGFIKMLETPSAQESTRQISTTESAAAHIPTEPDIQMQERVNALFAKPLLKLIQEAGKVHLENWPEGDIQRCSLLSIKTGHCPEDCSYCPQSARYSTDIEKHPLLDVEEIVSKARAAKEGGSSRFCMGAAWRKPPKGKQFENVLTAIREVKDLGLEVCATLGLLNEEQAAALRLAGLDVYNHNVDTSKDYYSKVITTRSFDDRVDTLRNVRAAGMQVCCGGILGMGESQDDRAKLIAFLASMEPQPESVPINMLVKVEGTPLENVPDIDSFDLVRTIAVARMVMPKTRLRLSAGRMQLGKEAQALCFVAGANSIFSGEKLLTTPLPGQSFDDALVDVMTESANGTTHECRN